MPRHSPCGLPGGARPNADNSGSKLALPRSSPMSLARMIGLRPTSQTLPLQASSTKCSHETEGETKLPLLSCFSWRTWLRLQRLRWALPSTANSLEPASGAPTAVDRLSSRPLPKTPPKCPPSSRKKNERGIPQQAPRRLGEAGRARHRHAHRQPEGSENQKQAHPTHSRWVAG